jgi:peptidyl-prolyl cis-trans isomerase A (cyclophilin A)
MPYKAASRLPTLVLLLTLCMGNVQAEATLEVLMKTSAGDVVIELYPESAPLSVNNFLRYVDGGYYENSQFYRVVRLDNQAQNNIKIEVIQGGLGMADEHPPFEPIAHEPTLLSGIRHTDGVISMARLEPGSAASEFFICINDQPELDFGGDRNPDGKGFAAFGKVIAGMDIIRAIQNMKTDSPAEGELEYTSGQILLKPVLIRQISRLAD